jgi:hypothetical protein
MQKWYLFLAILLVPVILTACGGGREDSVKNAEKYLNAIAAGDAHEAERYVCEHHKYDIGTAVGAFARYDMQVEEGDTLRADLSGITCSESEDRIACTYDVTTEVYGTVSTAHITETYGTNDDGLICGTLESDIETTANIQAASE